jgi:hypothetical protein
MSDDLDLDRIDQEIRINELREAAQEAAGGEMHVWENPDTPPEISEQFWANVLQYEQADETTHFRQLRQAGVEMPPPEELDDQQLTAKLWEVIHALARMNVFMSTTNHWNDRELYQRLWHDTLHEITADFPPGSGWNCHIDFLSSGGDEDNRLYLKYYADEEYRQQWHKDWPDEVIPPHEDPPYDRDSKLPKARDL